ncbi:MAG TPA: hypothetical protein VGO40_16595 [Longimicrobium sp.]|jgi:hypothetical protein|nr:hypothetical protein [Longimicrobium sp.]
MTDERRYGDEEVAEIFQAAASGRGPDGRALSSAGGLSLGELQAIGGEVGIAPERIAHAAAGLELRRGAAPRRTYLGMPVAVGRIVELPRAPTDREWELLVAELRETFGAHGKDGSRGGLRAWTNGNLHAYVEPTDAAHRLRLGTVKSNGIAVGRLGLAALLTALVLLAFLLTGEMAGDVGMAALFAAMGAAALGSNALRLPRWAHEREEQMEHIATRARSLIRADPDPGVLPEP